MEGLEIRQVELVLPENLRPAVLELPQKVEAHRGIQSHVGPPQDGHLHLVVAAQARVAGAQMKFGELELRLRGLIGGFDLAALEVGEKNPQFPMEVLGDPAGRAVVESDEGSDELALQAHGRELVEYGRQILGVIAQVGIRRLAAQGDSGFLGIALVDDRGGEDIVHPLGQELLDAAVGGDHRGAEVRVDEAPARPKGAF